MGNLLLQFTASVAALPILAMGLTSPLVSAGVFQPSLGTNRGASDKAALVKEAAKDEIQADKIDAFFAKRGMPLSGYGKKMVEEAEKNGLDWRLLPAISVQESTGGKQACGFNPFGWASCKITFNSWNHAIETVAAHLGGNKKTTAAYYKDATTDEILHHYNGTVMPSYPREVKEIMEMIGE